MRPTSIRILASMLLLAGGAAAVLAVEVWHALRQPRLPADPGFGVDLTIGEDRPGSTFQLVVLGDSLVAGVGASSAERSLAGRVAARVSAGLDRPVHVVGHGVSGAITREVLDDQVQLVPAGTDAIVLEVGSNDVLHRTTARRFRRDTERLLRAACRRAPIVVLGSAGELRSPVFLQPLRTVVVHRATQLRSIQREVADAVGVDFIDVAKEVSPAFNRARPESSATDRFHPSDLGYDIWSRPLAARVVRAAHAAGSGASVGVSAR